MATVRTGINVEGCNKFRNHTGHGCGQWLPHRYRIFYHFPYECSIILGLFMTNYETGVMENTPGVVFNSFYKSQIFY